MRTATYLALIMGAVSLAMLLYYYTIEKRFSTSYKDITALYDTMQSNQERITYGVLQSTFFAYYNQDHIAHDRQHLEQNIQTLLDRPILQKPHYADIRRNLLHLQEKVETYIALVEQYLLFNGAIKNSNVFLSAYESSSLELFIPGSNTQKHIHAIINQITQARKMLDAGYLKDIQKQIDQLKSGTYNEEQQRFIDNLLIHAQYITQQYPQHLEIFHNIINNPLRMQIETGKALFVEEAKDDFDYINRIALLLTLLIIMAIIAIITLLTMLKQENVSLKRLQKQLRYTFEHDALTRLKNRYSYENRVTELDRPAIILVNIAKFKFFNDVYGTDTGDLILKQVARLLVGVVDGREDAECFRISGDEFAILFADGASEQVQDIAARIDAMFSVDRFEVNGIMLHIAVNMTVSNQQPLLETADMAMKHLKANPTSNLLVYTEAHNAKEQIKSNIEMTQILRSALLSDRIRPHFQPIVDLKSRRIVKYEALVRLYTTDGRILVPFHFLPVAYGTPLYTQITKEMIRKSMQYFINKPYRFAINLSMQDLEDDSIVEMILMQLAADSETASRLDIELLESESLSNPEKVKAFIKGVKAFGCQVAIDDFGSGYSNFSYLTAFDIDIVKIDGSLVREITTNEEHYKTVKSIMSLITELGMKSVAEFVQDEESAELLTGLGVTQGQGYYFGKPEKEILSASQY